MVKLNGVWLAGAMAALIPSIAYAEESKSSIARPTPAIDLILKPIFDGMIKADYRTPIIAAFDRSPLWKQKVAEKENLLNQIDGAFKLYGPALSYELISTKQRGSLWEYRVYLVQQRDNTTRWKVWMSRTGGGWMIGYFSFDDQAQSWFAD